MNRTDTLNAVATSAEISKATADRALDAFESHLKAHIDAGQRVVIRGFGTFSRGLPSTRAGRNPRTGAMILIPAAKVPHFKASKADNVGAKFNPGLGLKAAVN